MLSETPRILVVDGDPVNILTFKRILEPLGMSISSTTSGSEAISMVQNEDYSVVLLDVRMPDVDGFDVARKIDGAAPIIFVTSKLPTEDEILVGYQLGAVDYLTKSFDPIILLSKIEVLTKLWRQKKRLSIQNNQLREFAGMIAHDFKQPITTIIGRARQVLRSSENHLCERSLLCLDTIVQSSGRMVAMMNGLLEYATAESKELELTEVNLNDVLNDIISDVELSIQDRNAIVEVHPLPTIMADSHQMYQAFINIINNAIKYSRDDVDPVITVSCQSDIIESGRSVKHRIVIEDNGIGFDESEAYKMFEPFSRLKTESTFDGAGVGLGTVKKIIDRHGGSINAVSPNDFGSIFSIEFIQNVKNNVDV